MRRNNDGGTVFANWMVVQNMIPLAVHSLPRKNLPISTFIANKYQYVIFRLSAAKPQNMTKHEELKQVNLIASGP